MKLKLSPLQLVRRISLGFFLGLSTLLAFLHQKVAGIPSIDALCPFGGLETLYKYAAGGEFIKKLTGSNITLLVIIIVLGVVLSRFFCGWICAFGALQGIFGKLGSLIFKRRFALPRRLDAALRYFKYVALVAILYLTWKTGELVIRPYDPWAAYGHLSAGFSELWAEFAVGFVVLIASLLLSLLYERAFCKYVCPLGAFNALLSRIPLFRIRRESETCISCSMCDEACPMNIDVMHAGTIDSPECIACGECVSACPTKKNTLAVFLAGKKVPLLVIALIGIGVYTVPLALGAFTNTIQFSEPTLKEIAATGDLRIEDIKGSTTYDELSASFGLDLEALFADAGIDPAKVPRGTKIKDTGALIGVADFETDTVRFAAAELLGLPYEGEHEAAPVDKAPAATDAAAPDAHQAYIPADGDFALTGSMSIKDIAGALGWAEARVLVKLGLPKDTPLDTPLRDLKDRYGFTMSTLKERINN